MAMRGYVNIEGCHCCLIMENTNIEWGSGIQILCFKHIQVDVSPLPEYYQMEFWNDYGIGELEDALWRKRSTLQHAMQVAFRKYCKKPEIDEEGNNKLPPDPFKFIPKEMTIGKSKQWKRKK